MGTSERSSADEVDPVAEFMAKDPENMRNQVITLDLFRRNTESLSNGGSFVDIYCRALVLARCSDALRRCSVARVSKRSLSLRS